jgi:Capsule assembly protein Wzi/PAP2 superfamily
LCFFVANIMRILCFSRTLLLIAAFAAIASMRGLCLQQSASSPPAPSHPPCVAGDCQAQSSGGGAPQASPKKPEAPPATDNSDNTVTVKKAFLNLPGDQKAIWTSPFRLRPSDSFWVVPLLGTTGVLLGSDRHSMQRERSNASAISLSNNAANGGLGVLVGVPAFMFAWGSWQGKPQMRETGLLSGEALVDSLVVNETLKVVFARERPTTANGQGKFFTDIGNSSFPSTHSMLSWTAASVIAHEYPGPLPQVLAYGTAAAVSVSRITGRQHFPADVVVGGALGWLIGRQVYKAHHDPELDGAGYGSFVRDPKEVDPSTLGSSFVPLDSWVYPALERLAALGYIKTQFAGLRPWTRAECLRQIEEAEYFAQDLPGESEIAVTLKTLREQFKEDGQRYQSISIESVYTGYTNISGVPLRDSYHFGQTLWNNQGRPYDQGSNLYTGASVSAVAGRFFMYARGEFQHAPGRPALTPAQETVIANMDVNPVLTPAPVSSTDRFYPLDMYAGVKLGEYAVTFGKQSLWLGPGESGPLMLSDNADPMYMLRLTRTTPLVLPGFLRHLGEIRGEFLVSKLSGHQFPQRPFFNLQKISFHPTQNLEIGFTRASLWAGVGHPFTAHSLLRNFTSNGDSGTGVSDPGDRKSGFDFSYRLPGLRNWLSLYSDFYSDDDPSPLANPRRTAINPGLYLSHFPRFAKLDLRVETVSTQSLVPTDRTGSFFYFNDNYHDSNTNKGYLFGNQTGRDGRTYQAWTTWHFSAATSLQFGYRDTKASKVFVPGGGTQSDASTRLQWQIRPSWSVDAFVQYERWFIPVLKPTAQNDVTGSVQLTYTPHLPGFLRKSNKTP